MVGLNVRSVVRSILDTYWIYRIRRTFSRSAIGSLSLIDHRVALRFARADISSMWRIPNAGGSQLTHSKPHVSGRVSGIVKRGVLLPAEFRGTFTPSTLSTAPLTNCMHK